MHLCVQPKSRKSAPAGFAHSHSDFGSSLVRSASFRGFLWNRFLPRLAQRACCAREFTQ